MCDHIHSSKVVLNTLENVGSRVRKTSKKKVAVDVKEDKRDSKLSGNISLLFNTSAYDIKTVLCVYTTTKIATVFIL